MLEFNNNHIITGYIKQLLADFNLPKYRVYTREFAEYFAKNGVESPEIIATVVSGDHIKSIPYIKDDKIQYYVKSSETGKGNWITGNILKNYSKIRDKAKDINSYNTKYLYNIRERNFTKNLQIKNNYYDTYTHNYLGDYLRFLRDYNDINLMSLYNCFNNNIVQNLNLKIDVNETTDSVTKQWQAVFSTDATDYRIYMIPVKLFKEYTIAIDSINSVEICCAVYDKYLDARTRYASLPEKTYQYYSSLTFSSPIVYTKIKDLISYAEESDLANVEQNLVMFLKVSKNTDSSIVILEGNYAAYNQSILVDATTEPESERRSIKILKNKAVINLADANQSSEVDINSRLDKLISPLQLLSINTGKSYPFADRLIEYLVGNVITPIDENNDNVKRVQTVMQANGAKFEQLGFWDNLIRAYAYAYASEKDDKTFTDCLGYIDKDIEKSYANKNKETIANIDIYPDIYLASKVKSRENN